MKYFFWVICLFLLNSCTITVPDTKPFKIGTELVVPTGCLEGRIYEVDC
jgi:hypothetical protein